MIKGILSPESCAVCKGCCFFDGTDLWEMPFITVELAEYIRKNYSSAELTETGELYKFSTPDNLKDNEIFKCPMLSETGCTLGENKPFDCRIYPFRIMKDRDGSEHIAVSEYCKKVSEIPLEEIRKFLKSSGLYGKIMEYKDRNPSVVIEYTEGYKIVF